MSKKGRPTAYKNNPDTVKVVFEITREVATELARNKDQRQIKVGQGSLRHGSTIVDYLLRKSFNMDIPDIYSTD